MPILIHLMRMAKSLSENKSIYLEKYVSNYYQIDINASFVAFYFT